MRILSTLVLVGAVVISAEAKRVKLEIGDKSPKWQGLKGIDDREHSLAELEKAKAVVVIFTCNDCPVAQSYLGRLSRLATKFKKKGIEFVAINPNKNESLKAMRAYGAKKKLNYQYLRDDTQEVAKRFGARSTPEVFLLNKDRKVAYMGAIDDDVQLNGNPKRHYLRDAIEAVLAGKAPPKTTTRAVGCAIRWK